MWFTRLAGVTFSFVLLSMRSEFFVPEHYTRTYPWTEDEGNAIGFFRERDSTEQRTNRSKVETYECIQKPRGNVHVYASYSLATTVPSSACAVRRVARSEWIPKFITLFFLRILFSIRPQNNGYFVEKCTRYDGQLRVLPTALETGGTVFDVCGTRFSISRRNGSSFARFTFKMRYSLEERGVFESIVRINREYVLSRCFFDQPKCTTNYTASRILHSGII